jgi:hypothetical protein
MKFLDVPYNFLRLFTQSVLRLAAIHTMKCSHILALHMEGRDRGEREREMIAHLLSVL